jgi:hypothetical protein
MDNKFLGIFNILKIFGEVTEDKMKIPEGFSTKLDMELFDYQSSHVGLLLFCKQSRIITGIEIPKIMENFNPLGIKSCDYYYSNQDSIPRDFKGKDNLFMRNIYQDKQGRLCVPNLYFMPFHQVWHRAFCTLSEVSDASYYNFPILIYQK